MEGQNGKREYISPTRFDRIVQRVIWEHGREAWVALTATVTATVSLILALPSFLHASVRRCVHSTFAEQQRLSITPYISPLFTLLPFTPFIFLFLF